MLAALEMPALATRMSSRIADDGAHPPGQNVRTVRLPQISADLFGAPRRSCGFRRRRRRLLLAAAEVNQHVRVGPGEGQGAGAADAREAPVTRAVFPERLLMKLISPRIRKRMR